MVIGIRRTSWNSRACFQCQHIEAVALGDPLDITDLDAIFEDSIRQFLGYKVVTARADGRI